MSKFIFFLAALISLNALAANECVNLSGTYTLNKGDCDTSSKSKYDTDGYFQELVGRSDSVIVYQGSKIRIEQDDCNSFKLTRIEGQFGSDQKYHDISYNYSSEGIENSLSSDKNSIDFSSLYVTVLVNKSEKMKLTKTQKGIAVNYSGRLLTLAFLIPTTIVNESRCELTKID